MSIKGKIKQIPPYYQTLGQGSFEFGEDTAPAHRFIPMGATSLLRGSTAEALTGVQPTSLLLSPYSRLIPVAYLRFFPFPMSSYSTSHAADFYRAVVRRQINNYLADHQIMDNGHQRKLQSFIPQLADEKRAQWSTGHPIGRILPHYWTETKETGGEIFMDFAQQYLDLDIPHVVHTRGTLGAHGAYSREDMLRAFNQFRASYSNFSQRTYQGHLDFGTLLYTPNTAQGHQSVLRPAVMAVMTPDQYLWQKLHILKTGNIDLQRVTFLVDRELDFTSFPINGLREFYKRNIEPWLLSVGANIWKVPVTFIEDWALLERGMPKAKNILQHKAACNELINAVIENLGSRYAGVREATLTSVITEEAVVPAGPALVISEEDDPEENYIDDEDDNWDEDARYDEDDEEEEEEEEDESVSFVEGDLTLDVALTEAQSVEVSERSVDDWMSMAAHLADAVE